MSTQQTSGSTPPVEPAAPHRCPLWMHWLLASPLRRLVESPEALLGPYVAPGMTVLEPGCGSGYFTLPLARMVGPGGRVLCVDVEPVPIERLLKRAERAGLSARIAASVCSPTELGLDDRAGQVDLVAVIHAMHELGDLPGFLRQVVSLLKPSGRMLVVEPKGHVTAARFAAQLDACRRAGLHEVPLGPQPKGRLVALLECRAD